MKTLLASLGVALMLAALYFFSMRSTARPFTSANPASGVDPRAGGDSNLGSRANSPGVIQPLLPRHAEIDRTRLAALDPASAGNKAAQTFDVFAQRAALSNEQHSRMLGLFWDLKVTQQAAMDADFWDFTEMYHQMGSQRTAAARSQPGYKSVIAQALDDLRDDAERRAREILTPEQYEIYESTGLTMLALSLSRDLPLTEAK